MDPQANLTEQAELLLFTDPATHAARLLELRVALRDWLARGGFEPDWTDSPYAAQQFTRWLYPTRAHRWGPGPGEPDPAPSSDPGCGDCGRIHPEPHAADCENAGDDQGEADQTGEAPDVCRTCGERPVYAAESAMCEDCHQESMNEGWTGPVGRRDA